MRVLWHAEQSDMESPLCEMESMPPQFSRAVKPCLRTNQPATVVEATVASRCTSPPRCTPLRPKYSALDAPKAPRREACILKPKRLRASFEGSLLSQFDIAVSAEFLLESWLGNEPKRDMPASSTSKSIKKECTQHEVVMLP